MISRPRIWLAILGAVLGFAGLARGTVVINEIMYRPGSTTPTFTVEDPGQEFIELYNTAVLAVDISNWALTSGVSYTFPPGTSIPANGYVVVASNPAAVQTKYGISGVFGPWAAGAALSNNGEKIELSMPVAGGGFNTIDKVTYASEGDWATRIRETAFGGWDWSTPANGGNASMELRNPLLSNDNGQNWAPSVAAAGATPGAANSVLTNNIPPIIQSVAHSPAVPTSLDNVTISCQLLDESAPNSLAATLYWRDATSITPGAFQTVAMTGDGSGNFSVTLAQQANLTVIEFYISASDGANIRTWPAPTSEGQNANCQYQVTNEVLSPTEAYYFLTLTGAENAAYNTLAANNPGSDRQFNQTLVVKTGTGTDIRYCSSMRIRGNSSRNYPFKPLRVSIPNDQLWDGLSAFNLNPKASYLQFMGMRLLQAAGVRAPDSIPVKPRRNGVEYTTSVTGLAQTPDFGRWVREEDLDGDFVANHFPTAKDGGLYKKGRPDEYWRNTGWVVPASPDGNIDGWTKQNNSSANDWTDLTGFFATVQSVTGPHFPGAPANNSASANGGSLTGVGKWNSTAFSAAEMSTLGTAADLDQWARWFAVMTILMDYETDISNGQDDDYGIYFAPDGLGHRRVNLLTHDMDTIFSLGDTNPAVFYNSVGLYDMSDDNYVFRPLLPLLGSNTVAGNATFRAKYLNTLRELYGTIFNADTTGNPNPPFYQFVDSHLTGWVPSGTINVIKTFATNRQAYLLGLIGSGATTPAAATSSATVTSLPGPLMISEVLASNIAAHQNGADFPDEIELYNAGAASINLAGKSLTDDPLSKTKYIFPAGTTIAAGGYLVVHADSDSAAPGLHTGFALSASGGGVYFYDSVANGQGQIDAIVFGLQISDYSIGRTGAALDTWALCTPTLGAANTAVPALAAPGGLLINEWAGNHDYLIENDFLELYNPAVQPVAIGAMSITNDFIDYPTLAVLPPLSFIGAGAFVSFDAKGSSATAGKATDLPFTIGADAGWLALIGQNGTIVDRVDIVAQPPDTSRGRTPDGGAPIATFGLPANLPTPGLSNANPPANILALMNGLRISEVQFKPNNLEFIELQNIGPTTLDLAGVRFTKGVDYTFPSGITLAPGALIVVCKDQSSFQAQYGAGVPLAPGVYGGSLDNSGEIIELRPPAPWEINILNFAYDPNWYATVANGNYSLIVIDDFATPARDWDQKSTWAPSPVPFGTPGLPAPPVITSAASTSGFLDVPFSFQVTATNSPTSYSANGLPGTLGINPNTGQITGTLTQAGLYNNITLYATNTGGTGMKAFTLTALSSGPLASFAWSPIGAAQQAGAPFAVTLTALDLQGRPVTSYSGTVPLTSTGAASPVLITECSIANIDGWELQNVSNSTVNTAGWFMVMNNNGGVNTIHQTYALPASLAPGEIHYRSEDTSDPSHYIGFTINWNAAGPNWAMLVDNLGTIRDFAVWGWTQADIATINFTVNGFTLNPSVQGVWTGDGEVIASNYGNTEALLRSGSSDHNSEADWNRGTATRGVQNTGLVLPFAPATIGIPINPASVTVMNGVFTGTLKVGTVATGIQITASDGAGHTGLSGSFNTVAPPVPVITSTGNALAVIGQPFSYQIVATNYVASFNAAILPDGLSVNTTTGLISGTPSTVGTSSVNLSAMNFSGTGTATLQLDVQADADGDGMGDAWETLHGLNPANPADAALDRDGDGQSNLAEWLAGTAPDDSSSHLGITGEQIVGSDFQIIWNSIPGKRYRVLMRPDLLTGSWINLTLSPIVPSGSTASFIHSGGASGAKRFYRVETVP